MPRTLARNPDPLVQQAPSGNNNATKSITIIITITSSYKARPRPLVFASLLDFVYLLFLFF